MYADTVVQDRLLTNPKFIAILLLVVTLVIYYMNPGRGFFGNYFAFLIGDPKTSGISGRAILSLILAAGFTANIVIIGLFPRRIQIGIVWIELALLFLALFPLFNLSLGFIQSKLWFLLYQGLATTLYVSAVSIVIATVLALIGAIAKLSSSGFAYGLASFYTSLFRGLPLLMQIFIIYIGIPQLGYVIDAVPAGIAALSLCYGAYMTEIFRAGIQSIPRGQWEASRALGFSPATIMRRIVLPQALPLVIPPIGNQFIAMLKDSSLVSVIGVWELMYLARTLGNQTFQHMEMLMTASLLYWIITIVLEVVQSRIEKYYRSSEAR